METDLARRGKQLAGKALKVQCAVSTMMIVIAGMAVSINAAISVAIGSLISVLPNVVFAFFAFRFSGASKSQMVVKSFSQGAKLRLLLATILFVIAFRFLGATPLFVFGTFAVASVSYWLTLLCQRQQ